ILYDHPAAPIDRDTDQLAWVERTLQSPGFDGLTIVVAHDDRPNLLAHWRSSGTLAERLRRGRIGLWLAGGHRDWDGVAFAELLRAAGPLRYVRTAQASSATLGGASGAPHYRVIDIIGDRVHLPGEGSAGGAVPSIPLGRLRAAVAGGTFEVASGLPFALDG